MPKVSRLPSPAVRPWTPPDPPRPADPARLAAMAYALLLVTRGIDACEPWGDEIAGDMLRATRRLGREDRDRLQAAIDDMADEFDGLPTEGGRRIR